MKRIVLDTNIIVSGIFWGGMPGRLYKLAAEQAVLPLSSEKLLTELNRVLHYPKFDRYLLRLKTTPDDLINQYRNMCELVSPVSLPASAVRDMDDVHVLACGVAGEADYIVSGDNDLLSLQQFQSIPIVDVAEMLNLLSE